YSYLCFKRNGGAAADSTNCSTAVDGSRDIVAIAPYAITWSGGEIDFNPSVRPAAEQTSSYALSFPVTQRYRIATINVKGSSGTVLRTYNITAAGNAATNSALRQVTKVQECVGSTCFAPTSFQWDNLAIGGGASGGQSVWSGTSAAFFHASIPNVK